MRSTSCTTARGRWSRCGGTGGARRTAARAALRRPGRHLAARRGRSGDRGARTRADRPHDPRRGIADGPRPLRGHPHRQRRRAAAVRPRRAVRRAPPRADHRRAGRLARARGRRRGPARERCRGGRLAGRRAARVRARQRRPVEFSGMSEVQSGLEGVVAFATQIAEPDKEGSALRYRGVDIEELVGTVPFEKVWGLLVDGEFEPGLPPAEPWPLTMRSGDARVDVQSALAMLAPEWGFRQLIDISDEECRDNLARASVMALSFVAQSARGTGRPPVPQTAVDRATSIPERFLIRWRGEADPDHVKAIDAYWISAAEHGMNASTFTARVIASTGADVAAALSGAVGALSGPLHGGAPSRVLKMLDEVEKSGNAEQYVKDLLDRGERLMGFGHRVYRAEDPRARVLRRTAHELGAKRAQVAEELEKAALAELHAPNPPRVHATNVEFWSAFVLDYAEIPPDMFTPMFTCARVAGWSAHILEQKREARLIRPTAKYVGRDPRPLAEAMDAHPAAVG